MRQDRDLMEERLRGLRLGRPHPALRQRTRGALRRALTAPEPAPGFRLPWWLAEWRLEGALAISILICFGLAAALPPLPAELHAPRAAPPAPDLEAVVNRLDIDDLEPYLQLRLVIAQRHQAERRYHHVTYRHFDFGEF